MEPFKIEVPWDELRKKKLFVATPMYGGMCIGTYSKSIADLSAICTHHGIHLSLYYLFNESLITRARSYAADEFMRSGCDHMMFIDADVGFNANDILTLMAVQHSDPDKYPVIGGVYPKKTISWEKIVHAVKLGRGDDNPQELEKFVGDYVFNPLSDTGQISLQHPCKVAELGTGFMMIHRSAFEKFDVAYPEKKYLPDHVRTEAFDGSREITLYFDCRIEPESKRYLSEDYNFCYDLRRIGLDIWILPWIKLTHTGTMTYGGSLMDLASIQVSPTADINALKKENTNEI